MKKHTVWIEDDVLVICHKGRPRRTYSMARLSYSSRYRLSMALRDMHGYAEFTGLDVIGVWFS